MPSFRAWPFVFLLVGCDGDAQMSTGLPAADGGSDAGPLSTTATLAGPAPALASSPRYGAPPKLQFRVLAGRGSGAPVDGDVMLAALRSADAVCLGETHDSFAVHSMQLLLIDRLRQLGSVVDSNWGMGFEMFQRPFQSALDDFASGRIAEGTFRANSQFDVRWGFEWELYQPLVLHGIAHGHPLRALLAEKELTSRITAVGFAGLTPQETGAVPELVLTNESHRAWFRTAIAAGHPNLTDALFERLYTIQVVWDETMADTASVWLKAAFGRRMAIIAGRGHCIDMAIPDRLRRRGVGKVVALQIEDEAPGSAEATVLRDPADFVVSVKLSP